ncbi:MAG: hypothetical protein D6720_12220 [Gammaproteobacteria bacterium]|nr:MAG: hypothetical protein D6720_12220 [Gammaproteobacteria bacterium]
MKRFLSCHLAILLFLWLPAQAIAADETALIEVRHRPAIDLVAPVKELLGEEGSVSTHGNRLIVRAPEARLDEVRWLVQRLDRLPRSLIVEVKTDRGRQQQRTSVNIDGYGMQAQVQAFEAHTRRRGAGVQRVRTLDGRPALIRIGRSVPVYQIDRRQDGPYVEERMHLEYKDITTGIHVLPRVHGDQVTVEIYQQAERPAMRTGEFETQQAATVVTGRLGEWIPVGSIAARADEQQRGIGIRARTRAADELQVSVRVLPADSAPFGR